MEDDSIDGIRDSSEVGIVEGTTLGQYNGIIVGETVLGTKVGFPDAKSAGRVQSVVVKLIVVS
jgi:hypothetical protein